jgi:SOS response regulatory protein OraA/RecX
MKQLIDSPLHTRATNYALHKITEGVSETRIIGELIALENIRRTTANEIVQKAKTLFATTETKSAFFGLYEWIQEWSESGKSTTEIIEQLTAKGIERAQAQEVLEQAMSFQNSKKAQINKVKTISANSSQIHRQVQNWRKQLISPQTIQQKLQKEYNLTPEEAQSMFFSASLHNKAQQQVQLKISDHCPEDKRWQCMLTFCLIILSAISSYLLLEGITGQILTAIFSTMAVVFVIRRFTRRNYQQTSYIR